jgi:hypothetical protein
MFEMGKTSGGGSERVVTLMTTEHAMASTTIAWSSDSSTGTVGMGGGEGCTRSLGERHWDRSSYHEYE